MAALALQLERLVASTPPAHPDHRAVADAWGRLDALRRQLLKMEVRVTRVERAAPWLAKVANLPPPLAAVGCVGDVRALQLRPAGGTAWVPARVVHLFVFAADLVLATVVPRWRQLGSLRDDLLLFDTAVPLKRVVVLAEAIDDPLRPFVLVVRLGDGGPGVALQTATRADHAVLRRVLAATPE